MSDYIYAGDSWALKGFTDDNWDRANHQPVDGDVLMADHWGMSYEHCLYPGHGNLEIMDRFLTMNVPADKPVIWIYTEPGRDFGRITGKEPFDWIKSEEIFNIRQELDVIILKTIRETIPNPISLVGGISDVNQPLAESLGFHVTHSSWQQWMAKTLDREQYFKFGWGAADIGWRLDYNNVKPSKAALFAWDELIKEWCMWADLGYMCHEHPTLRSNKEFADFLRPNIINWILYGKK